MIIYLTISLLQIAVVIIFGAFFRQIPNVVTCGIVNFLCLSYWLIDFKNINKDLFFKIFTLINGIGLAFLLPNGPTLLYVGYALLIAAQALLAVHINIKAARRGRLFYALAFVIAFVAFEFLGVVIMQSNELNVAMMLMMALVTLLLVNLIFWIYNQLPSAPLLSIFVFGIALLFTGLGVIEASFNPVSVFHFLLNLPWHFGVMFLAFSHMAFNYPKRNAAT